MTHAFSIVVPSYRRPMQLANCLQGLSRLNYPRDRFDVIVVDDGSPKSPADVIDAWRGSLNLTLIVQENMGPAAARNHGAECARRPYIAFTDDDCVPHPEWLQALSAAFDASPDHLIGGAVVNALPQNPYASASQQLVSFLNAYFDGRNGRTCLFTSNNMAVHRDHFRAVGGFDTHFPRAAGEDREFCDRWVALGRGTTFCRGAIVLHAHALTLKTFWRQHFEYGRGAARFRRLRAARENTAVQLEPLSFYLDLLRSPFKEASTSNPLKMSVLLGLAQAANASGFVWSLLGSQQDVSRTRPPQRPGTSSTRAAPRWVATAGDSAPPRAAADDAEP